MTLRFILVAAFTVLTGSAWSQPPARSTEPSPAGFTNPVVLLLRDPAVQKELRLEENQKKAIDALIAEVDEPLWQLRDLPPQEAWNRAKPLVEKVENGITRLFDLAQRRRFGQIVLQSTGTAAISRAELAPQLQLSAEQRQQLLEMDETAQRELRELQEKVRGGQEKDGVKKAAALQARLDERRISVLSDAQKQKWAALLGRPFDFSHLRKTAAIAPELRDVDAWVNSAPLTLAGLRGKVVVLHFWTFGCINCVHNYPWYRGWHERWGGKGLTVLGIHTPESAGERVVAQVEKKAKENRLAYPIAVDNAMKNWEVWANRWWPSTYLIDKQGRVRYWWYGELDLQDGHGGKLLEQKIAELLSEGD